MIYKLVPFHEVGEFVAKNAKNHFDHMVEEKLQASPQIDWEYYISLSHLGQCIASVMLDSKDEIRGYSVFTISNNPIYKNILQAYNEALFVDEGFRKYSVKFMKETNRLLKEFGISEINYVLQNDKLGKLMALVGCKNKYKMWSI